MYYAQACAELGVDPDAALTNHTRFRVALLLVRARNYFDSVAQATLAVQHLSEQEKSSETTRRLLCEIIFQGVANEWIEWTSLCGALDACFGAEETGHESTTFSFAREIIRLSPGFPRQIRVPLAQALLDGDVLQAEPEIEEFTKRAKRAAKSALNDLQKSAPNLHRVCKPIIQPKPSGRFRALLGF